MAKRKRKQLQGKLYMAILLVCEEEIDDDEKRPKDHIAEQYYIISDEGLFFRVSMQERDKFDDKIFKAWGKLDDPEGYLYVNFSTPVVQQGKHAWAYDICLIKQGNKMKKPKILCVGDSEFQKVVRQELAIKQAPRNGLKEGDVRVKFTKKVKEVGSKDPDYVLLSASGEDNEELIRLRCLFLNSEIVLAGPMGKKRQADLYRNKYDFVVHATSVKKFARWMSAKIHLK